MISGVSPVVTHTNPALPVGVLFLLRKKSLRDESGRHSPSRMDSTTSLDAKSLPSFEPESPARDRDRPMGLDRAGRWHSPRAIVAVIAVPEFTTQDGPAHLYNARILERVAPAGVALRRHLRRSPGSPCRTGPGTWPRWQWPRLLPTDIAARAPDRPDAGRCSPASVVWLRWSVAGPKGLATAWRCWPSLLGLERHLAARDSPAFCWARL